MMLDNPTLRLFQTTSEHSVEKAIYVPHNPHNQPKRYKSIPGKDDYTALTIELLTKLYPKTCPTCNIPLTKHISTRSYVIRCKQCHHQSSRLKDTPLQGFKLPLHVFGWCLNESIQRYPKVLTAIEIQRRLGVAKNTATLLKRRLQLLASEHLPKLNKLIYNSLQNDLANVTFPRDDDKDLHDLIKGKNIPQVDTMALYSASQRANKGRKRFRNSGLTASIYLSDKLGGEQIGTLVQTISWKNGPVIYDSIPDNTGQTLRPLLDRYIPKNVPVFTDEGYKFYYRINKNHRMINHSLKSKDKRYRFSRERWSKNGIHTQCAEGHHRNLKWNFTAGYGYIKPKWSQLYLNEYAFWRNVKYYGWDALLDEVKSQSETISTSGEFSSVDQVGGGGDSRLSVVHGGDVKVYGAPYVRKGKSMVGERVGKGIRGRGGSGDGLVREGRVAGVAVGRVGNGELRSFGALSAESAQPAMSEAGLSDVRKVRHKFLTTHDAHQLHHLGLNGSYTHRCLYQISRYNMPAAHCGENPRHTIFQKTNRRFAHTRTPDAVV